MNKALLTAATCLGLATLSSCATAGPGGMLELQWQASGLAQPESVALSRDGTFLYVSNMAGDGSARDGNGFISRVSLTGEVLEREWLTGLDAPKGIMRRGDLLYVSDISGLTVFDTTNRSVLRRVDVPDARFLNDLAFASDGRVVISDSANARIYVFLRDTVSVWLEDERLRGVNGLLLEPNRMLAVTMQGLLLAIDNQTLEITVLAEGLGAADGIAALGDGRYLVSEWRGRLSVVAPDGSHEVVLDTRDEGRYLNDFIIADGVVYMPNLDPGALSAYRIAATP